MMPPDDPATPPSGPGFDTIKLLVAHERQLTALRSEYDRYQRWMEAAQRTTAAIATVASPEAAFKLLVRMLVSDSSYEHAAVAYEGRTFAYGVELGDEGRRALAEAAAEAAAAREVRVVSRPLARGDDALGWALAGPVAGPDEGGGPAFVLCVGRTARTAGFYP
ncbi:MAG TPA: hypothetical protein VFS00_25475, partial [Polyangiaceae bacterium]|nr:hypothetical protein [Polyangiaceae bacterium]